MDEILSKVKSDLNYWIDSVKMKYLVYTDDPTSPQKQESVRVKLGILAGNLGGHCYEG